MFDLRLVVSLAVSKNVESARLSRSSSFFGFDQHPCSTSDYVSGIAYVTYNLVRGVLHPRLSVVLFGDISTRSKHAGHATHNSIRRVFCCHGLLAIRQTCLPRSLWFRLRGLLSERLLARHVSARNIPRASVRSWLSRALIGHGWEVLLTRVLPMVCSTGRAAEG